MVSTTTGQIFLADHRGHTETENFRSLHTLPVGNYQPANKAAVGALCLLNDETLAGGSINTFVATEDLLVLVLPLVGAVVTSPNSGPENKAEAGELQLHYYKAGDELRIGNPYATDLVNYLLVGFRCQNIRKRTSISIGFDLQNAGNRLMELFAVVHEDRLLAKASIGRFDGRSEAEYHCLSPQNRVMLLVVQGAFEAANRLLESRDALSLCGSDTVEIEALSNEAILLVFEMKA